MAENSRKNGHDKANLGFEAMFWATADLMRNNMDAAEYKRVALALIFLRYSASVPQSHSSSCPHRHPRLRAHHWQHPLTLMV